MMRPSSVVDETTAMQNGRQRCHALSAELLEKINPLGPSVMETRKILGKLSCLSVGMP